MNIAIRKDQPSEAKSQVKKIPTAGASSATGRPASAGSRDASTTGDRSKDREPQTAARK